MIPFEQALRMVLDAAGAEASLPKERCEQVSLQDSCGRILQQPVTADRDMPPFDKSAVDGYACLSVDALAAGPMRLLETIPAGGLAHHTVTSGTCSKIMTGAVVPKGADYVLMVEDAAEEHGVVRCTGRAGGKTNICLQGEDLRSGTQVLSPGLRIRPQHIAVLAAMGYADIRVSKQVRAGIISTGDELVEPCQRPRPAQIRNSNSWQLMAQAAQAGASATYYGIARDRADSFAPLLSAALNENEVVIVSGGVSTGDFDIVPETAQQAGIRLLFDRIAVQPGKPTVFGAGADRFFFGLPGNPVSTFIQFALMVKPFLLKRMGAQYAPLSFRLPLARSYTRKHPERMAHLPAAITPDGQCLLLPYNGSGHSAALGAAECLARIPAGITVVATGEPVEIILL